MNNKYWTGPFNTLVDSTKDHVIGYNDKTMINKFGDIIFELPNGQELSKNQYLEKHCKFNDNTSKYHYISNDEDFFAGYISTP